MSQPRKLLLTTDGSSASKVAFFQVLEFLDKGTYLTVTHISDSRKSYLPYDYQSTTIYDDYHSECLSRIHQDNYQMIFREKNYDQSIQENILDIAQETHQNFIFMGYHGRKGVKEDATILGTTVYNAVYKSQIPSIIIKEVYTRKQFKNFNFLVLIDGSEKSMTSLKVAKQLRHPQDKILIVNAPFSKDNEDRVKNMVEEHVKDDHIEFQVIKNVGQDNETLADTIIKFINEDESFRCDFVVVENIFNQFGNNGKRAQIEKKGFIGKLSQTLLTRAHANLIMIP